LLLLFSPNLSFSDESVEGIWSAVVRTKGGLGSQWTFLPKGEVSYTFGALVDFKYEIEDDYIKMRLIETTEETKNDTITERFTITKNTLTVVNNNSSEKQIMEWAGIPSPPKTKTHPIVGNWTYTHYTGQPALMRYSSKGIVQLTVPFTVENGSYSREGGKITVKFHNEEPVEYTVKRNGNGLILKNPKETKETELQLFEY
jgi:hypothetical protein